MAHDASNNNPVKEIIHSLLGILLLLVIISGIAVSAWLRPAGNHEPATEPATPAGKALAEKIAAIENPAPEKTADTAPTAEATNSATDQVQEADKDSSTAVASTASDTPADKAQEPAKADNAQAKTETAEPKPAN